jgi:hypothetical protein
VADRGFSSTIESALAGATVGLALLVELALIGGTVRAWSGNGTIQWNGFDWDGTGKLGNIDKVTDSVDPADIGIVLTLNYIDDDIRNEFIVNDNQGAAATIYLALMDPSTGVVSETYALFVGFVDQVDITDAGDQGGQLKVRLASELARLNRVRFMNLSDAHQQRLFAGDKGMEFASRMDETVYWGRKPLTPVQGGGSGDPSYQGFYNYANGGGIVSGPPMVGNGP